MVSNRIADLFEIRNRFMRSTHLERDFVDPEALRGYVITPPVQVGLERLVSGLKPESSQRAWRITGDYGTGKSSFALALARVLTGQREGVPSALRSAVDFRKLGVERSQLLPILVTGSRAPVAACLLQGVAQALDRTQSRGKRPQVLDRIRSAADAGLNGDVIDGDAIELLSEAVRYVRESGRGSGALVVLDELGKFLEYAALHPDRQDIYFLQTLAECASRSGDTPLIVVSLIHQGFNAYAEQLSHGVQKEWEKVAGRFEEILFNQPLEQTTTLIADALNVRVDRLPKKAAEVVRRDMARAVEMGWYGAGAGRKGMVEIAPRLYPLHPTVVPVLVRLFSLFGQNERSLFSFLLTDEPYALQSFAQQTAAADREYRIDNLYDYARATFGHRLAVQSYRSHWNQIESVVESFPRDQEFQLRLLKTVAMLNLIDSPSLLASEAAIALSVVGVSSEGTRQVKAALPELQRGTAVLYFRGSAGGYCLWPHTSVNLERAYQEALKAVPIPEKVATLIKDDLEDRPLVARRHYIETGNLRYFSVEYVSPDELSAALVHPAGNADGRILVALCETEDERAAAVHFAKSKAVRSRDDLLVAVPRPLKGLANLLLEVQRWEWVARNVPELSHDAFALEEVSRQLAAARQVLNNRVRVYVGLRQFTETTDLEWFYHGSLMKSGGGRKLLETLSDICDKLYQQAPHFRNELVNRDALSSAAAAARLRLIENVLNHPTEPFLGMDPAKKPPEMSMYLSVLQYAKLHRQQEDTWAIVGPPNNSDPCNVRPVLKHILKILEGQRGGRVRATDLFAQLRQPPYGLRDGIVPLLMAVFAVMHEQNVAFYEKGSFVRQVTIQEFQRLIKVPEAFELQYCTIGGVRAAVFQKLLRVLNPDWKKNGQIDLLDVVKPLCVFAAQLPSYTHKTSSLSSEAVAVREALLHGEEPATLLFQQLPRACGVEAFESEEAPSPQRVRQFVNRLRAALDELRTAYSQLIERIKDELLKAFDRPGGFDQVKSALALSVQKLLVSVSEPRLKAFCLRLGDSGLPEQEWVESIASFICSKPPGKWADVDLAFFCEELGKLSQHFRRVESAVFESLDNSQAAKGLRVAITHHDGTEVNQVVFLDPAEEDRVAVLEAAVTKMLEAERRLGVIAATRAISGQLRHLSGAVKTP